MRHLCFCLLLPCLLATRVQAANGRGYDMDYAPAFAYTVQATNETVTKGITVRMRAGTNVAAVLFDTETLRYAAGWTGGWLDLSKTHLTTYKGELPPRAAGRLAFTTEPGPGWANGGTFDEPRTNGIGPLPRNWARYRGFYRYGSNVVFSYTVGEVEVLDMPGLIVVNGELVFTRTVQVSDTAEPLMMKMSVAHPQARSSNVGSGLLTTAMNVADIPREADIIHTDLRPFCRGGPALWPQVLTTSGKIGDDFGPFAVDTVAIPENNPWRSWMRLTALDFFSDGRAAVCTWNGDVWIVSGLDDALKAPRWKRFAAGLFDPLGLKILRDEVYVLERSQITRLRDLNNDGEADFYENFNNDAGVSPSYHAFAMDLQTDQAGNFYYTRAGQRVDTKYPLNGGMARVSADGSRAELIAHGLRAANGVGIGPNDEIVCSDNQGNWIPASRLNMIQPGGFYGYVPHAHSAVEPETYLPPLCWLPVSLDNSGGGQVWVTGAGWPGALTNHLLHTSYGMAALHHVLWETIDGVAQGGVVKLPLKFDSGIQRARFHPRDGQLWVTGLKGWQTKGIRDGALQRVRYTGKPLRMPLAMRVRREGIEIDFSDPLSRASAEDPQNWSLEQWNYRWTEKYGSDDFSVANPEKKGRDRVTVSAVGLAPNNKTVFISISDLKPVMQMRIRFSLRAADDAPVDGEIFNTINRVPER